MFKIITELILRKLRFVFQKEGNVKILKNMSWLSFERGFRIGISFFVGLAISRYLQPEGWGYYSKVFVVLEVVKTFSLLGLGGLTIRYLVKEPEKTNEILGTFIIFRTISIFALSFFILIPYIYFFEDSLYTNLYIFSFGFLFFAPLESFRIYFESKTEIKKAVIASSLAAIIVATIKIYFLWSKKSIVYFVSMLSLETFIIGILTAYYYQKTKWRIQDLRIKRDILMRLLREGWPITVSSISVLGQIYIDQIMVEDFISATELGYYSAATKLVTIYFAVAAIFSTSFFPTLIKLYKEQTKTVFMTKFQKLLDISFLINLAFPISIFLLGSYLIEFAYGKVYSPAIPILKTYVWITILIINISLLERYILIKNKQKYSMYKGIGAFVLNISLNIILIPIYQGIGAAIATLITYSYVSYWGYLFFKPLQEVFLMQTKSIFGVFRYLRKVKQLI